MIGILVNLMKSARGTLEALSVPPELGMGGGISPSGKIKLEPRFIRDHRTDFFALENGCPAHAAAMGMGNKYPRTNFVEQGSHRIHELTAMSIGPVSGGHLAKVLIKSLRLL